MARQFVPPNAGHSTMLDGWEFAGATIRRDAIDHSASSGPRVRRREEATFIRPVALAHERCQVDAVVGSSLAHQPAYVGRYGWYADAKVAGDLTIGSGQQDQFDHLLLTNGKLWGSVHEAGIADLQEPVDELAEHPARRADVAAHYHINREPHHIDFRVQVKIGSGPGRDHLQGQIMVF